MFMIVLELSFGIFPKSGNFFAQLTVDFFQPFAHFEGILSFCYLCFSSKKALFLTLISAFILIRRFHHRHAYPKLNSSEQFLPQRIPEFEQNQTLSILQGSDLINEFLGNAK